MGVHLRAEAAGMGCQEDRETPVRSGNLMYGRMHGDRTIYVCGRYMRTEGSECENNAIDGDAMLRFTLKTLRQLVDRHGNRDKLRQKLLKRAKSAAQEQTEDAQDTEV